MNIFTAFGTEINYDDILQCDAAISKFHKLYGKSPIFNGVVGNDMFSETNSEELNANLVNHKNPETCDYSRKQEKASTQQDQIILWKNFWLEYINAFDNLQKILPNSVVTVFIGRQATEIGFKYLLLSNGCSIKKIKTHDLADLSRLFFDICNDKPYYLEWLEEYCTLYCKFIEDGYPEYFRYPEYKNSSRFTGTDLDVSWLSYNFSLILLKLIHFSGLDSNFE
ncbi:hypothetical protein [uncultured Faecalibaculum sp.]|uniref:hypothetical protein n=1 Tax=uncultured Faecalibaculum sp. TaxID=1729681 RepID=UPI002711D6B2|nr:hypothetical protein [uncultured Faecalibaculum sp.]